MDPKIHRQPTPRPVNANRYAYAACNATTYVDTTGLPIDYLEACWIGAAGGAVTGALSTAAASLLAGPFSPPVIWAAALGGAFAGCVGGVLTKYLTFVASQD